MESRKIDLEERLTDFSVSVINIALLIIHKLKIYTDQEVLNAAKDENNHLIAVFVASVKTAKNKNLRKDK